MAAIDPGFNGFVPTPSNTTLAPNAMSFTGGGLAHDNNQPTQALVWCIAVQGTFPSFG
jgi:microcystin-dependent protein